ncbi:hypothetical protein N9M22_06570 [Litoricolaceae bacterium]|nr:hypothetical protein [Litorivicinaceae bacterium]
MTVLRKLNLVAYERESARDPKIQRRKKLIAKIEEQIQLASDPQFQPVKTKWIKDEYGSDQKVTVPKRVKRWWHENLDGSVVLTIRYGSEPLEFAKGKAGIAVENDGAVVPALEQIKAGVAAGDLDQLLDAQSFTKRRRA